MNVWIENLIDWDYYTFRLINDIWSNQIGDAILPWLREPMFWTPVYIFIAVYFIYNYQRTGIYWLITLILIFVIGDEISASIIKPWVHRIRPCSDPIALEHLRLLVPCGSGKSFPSTHATNHFAISSFMVYSLRHLIGYRLKWLLWIWAASVAYSQVYVGVHFPLDVIAGGILGYIIGRLISNYYLCCFRDIIHY